MNKLTRIEQVAVDRLHAAYEDLSSAAKSELAQRVSWAECHLWTVAILAAILGLAAGAMLGRIWT